MYNDVLNIYVLSVYGVHWVYGMCIQECIDENMYVLSNVWVSLNDITWYNPWPPHLGFDTIWRWDLWAFAHLAYYSGYTKIIQDINVKNVNMRWQYYYYFLLQVSQTYF